MNRYHKNTDIKLVIALQNTSISDMANLYVIVFDNRDNSVKRLSMNPEVGFVDGDITAISNAEFEMRIHRAETLAWGYGDYSLQILASYSDADFNMAVRIDSDSIEGFSLVADNVKTITDSVLEARFPYSPMSEAPTDGGVYGRQNEAWTEIDLTGEVEEAPENGNTYGRRNAAWVLLDDIGAVTSVNGQTGVVALSQDNVPSGVSALQFSVGDKSKLDGIAVGAQTNTVNSVAGKFGDVVLTKADVSLGNVDNTSDQNKPISIATQAALNNKVDVEAGRGLSDENFSSAEKTKLAGIDIGAEVNLVTSVAGKVGGVSLVKADVQLGNVDNTSDASKPISIATQAALDNKVDVEAGRGLSDENFTSSEKTKLANVNDKFKGYFANSAARDAAILTPIEGDYVIQEDTNSTWYYNGTAWVNTGSTSTGDMFSSVYDPTSVGGDAFNQDNMNNGAVNRNFTATEQAKLAGIDIGAEVNAVNSVNGLIGSVNITPTTIGLDSVDNTSDANKPISIATQAALDNKVDVVVGRQLSEENFSLSEKTKLAGIDSGAQANTVFSVNSQTGAVNLTQDSISDTASFVRMTPSERSKLGSIEANAQQNTVDSVNSLTGAINLNQDNIPDGVTYVRLTQTEKTSYAAKINEAPTDGSQYVRQSGGWSVIDLNAALSILAGGTTGQVLQKASDADYDFQWVTIGTGDVTVDGGTANSIFDDLIDGGTANSTFDDTIDGGGAFI